MPRYTEQELIDHLLRRTNELKRTPKFDEMKRPGGDTYSRRFGSWHQALQSAGFPESEWPKIQGTPPYQYGPPPNTNGTLGHFIAGFIAGEGCFGISVSQNPKYKFGYSFSPYFSITIHERDLEITQTIRRALGCGHINPGFHSGHIIFGVTNLKEIIEKVIPFFVKFGFRGTFKEIQFKRWRKVIALLNWRVHFTQEGASNICTLSRQINKGYNK